MSDVFEALLNLQMRIERSCDPELPSEFDQRLSLGTDGDLLHVDFYCDPYGEKLGELFGLLASPGASSRLASLWLRGPDEGSNGTRNWDLGPLVETSPGFPQLRSLCVEQTLPGDHNCSIIGREYEEEGQLTALLAKSPLLEWLTVPSAPSASFFHTGSRPLRYLSIDAGYDHQGFILHLSRSKCFTSLRTLEIGECNLPYADDFVSRCTPFEHYQALFVSEAFANVSRFVWRNPLCTPEQIEMLKRLRSDIQFLVVRTSAEYVR